MNFKLNSIVLALAFSSSALLLPDGVAAVVASQQQQQQQQQQQLRGSRSLSINNSPRSMVAATGSNFCPKVAPTDGSSCANVLPDGMSGGNCGWQHSSWNGDTGTKTTTIDNCTCTGEQGGNWSCSKEIKTNTSPPAPPPPPATTALNNNDDGSNWCPKYSPISGTECAMVGMWVGTCYFSSSAQEGEVSNNNSQACTCQNGRFTCRSEAFPKDDVNRSI
jgi:hypothetical protein